MCLHGVRGGGGISHIEHGLKHFDDVLEAVLLVVENDDVVELAEFVFGSFFGIGV